MTVFSSSERGGIVDKMPPHCSSNFLRRSTFSISILVLRDMLDESEEEDILGVGDRGGVVLISISLSVAIARCVGDDILGYVCCGEGCSGTVANPSSEDDDDDDSFALLR